MPEERRDEHREEKNNNKLWPWILAAGMVGSSVIMCLCGRGCTKGTGCGGDCGKTKHDTVWVVKYDTVWCEKEKPCDEKCDCNKNCGCNKKQCDCKKTKPKSEQKTEQKREQKREQKQEQKQEPECKTVTKTTYEHFCISGDANDVVNAAIRIVNSNQR